jgi:hypothetical protein
MAFSISHAQYREPEKLPKSMDLSRGSLNSTVPYTGLSFYMIVDYFDRINFVKNARTDGFYAVSTNPIARGSSIGAQIVLKPEKFHEWDGVVKLNSLLNPGKIYTYTQPRFATKWYAASQTDVLQYYGKNWVNIAAHYLQSGQREKRKVYSFDALRYIASYRDLVAAFGANIDKGAEHYAESGFWEGRNKNLFQCQVYGDIYADLRNAYGYDCEKLTLHWITAGYREGRKPGY